MRWSWPRKAVASNPARTIKPESRSLRVWFTRATKDPFHQDQRAKTRREFVRMFAELDALDEEDFF